MKIKPKILVASDYYLPGYKGGGPIRSVANMIDQLSDEFDFTVITQDHDLGDRAPYTTISETNCQQVGSGRIYYQSKSGLSLLGLREIIEDVDHDLLYLNSFFSPVSTIRILLLRKLGMIPKIPVVIAPRGEFSSGAITLKKFKKSAWLFFVKLSGLVSDVIWQASSQFEEEDIRRYFGDRVKIFIASDMAPGSIQTNEHHRRKIEGQLRVVFLSRISPMKNLDGLLHILNGYEGNLELSIYGPIEDENYWEKCRQMIDDLPPDIKVSYHGSVGHDKIHATFSEHDLFFFPTRGENFGHVILEAFCAGCPVLISDQTPWRDLQEKGVGWDLPLDESESFLTVLKKIRDMEDETFQTLSKKASEYGKNHLRNDKIRDLNIKLFHEALGGEVS